MPPPVASAQEYAPGQELFHLALDRACPIRCFGLISLDIVVLSPRGALRDSGETVSGLAPGVGGRSSAITSPWRQSGLHRDHAVLLASPVSTSRRCHVPSGPRTNAYGLRILAVLEDAFARNHRRALGPPARPSCSLPTGRESRADPSRSSLSTTAISLTKSGRKRPARATDPMAARCAGSSRPETHRT